MISAELKIPRKFVLTVLVVALLGIGGCARAPKQPVSRPISVVIPPAGAGFYVTLEKGQTIYRLAKMYKVDAKELMRVNRIQNPSQLSAGQQIFIPQGGAQGPARSFVTGGVSLDEARRIVGPFRSQYRWETITVHHSGTLQGSAKNFDRDHQRRRMGGLFYHFVIGNGTTTGDGQVETGFRWQRQVKANRPYDIQICLVGNFDKQEVSSAQFGALVNMIRALQETYNIPTSRIRQHCDIPGKHTDCPGKRFPFRRLVDELR